MASIDTAPSVVPLDGQYALVDLETTGGNIRRHRVIEVGIVLYEQGRVVEEWSSLVNPGSDIPAGIEAFTGISNAMVADAPPFAAVASEITDRLEGHVFVAHNARFDHGFLRHELRRLGQRLNGAVLCTVRLSRRLYPHAVHHSLDAVMARHGIDCVARHRALGDAQVLARFLDCAVAEHGPAVVEAAIAELSARVKLPPQLPPDLAEELPDAPGVYRLYGAAGTLLCLGRAANLRNEVIRALGNEQHVMSGHCLAREVQRVEWTECAGAVGTALLEAQLRAQLQPALQKRRRGEGARWTIRLQDVAAGLRAVIEPFDAEDTDETYGVFRSERDARRALDGLVRDRELCRKALGLEPGGGSCLARQVDRCRGACVGVEPRGLHAARVRLALHALRFPAPPYARRIGIRECGLDGDEVHVIEGWRYLGTARTDRELAELACDTRAVPFDVDVFRILRRAFQKTPPRIVDLAQFRRDD